MRLIIEDIEIEVTRKNIKNMYLKVLPPDGTVVVSAPVLTSKKQVSRFVLSKKSWIEKQRKKVQARVERAQHEGVSGGVLSLWGKQYSLKISEGVQYNLELALDEEKVNYTVRKGSTPEQQEAWLREWQRKQLCKALEVVVPKWEKITGLHLKEWRTKYMKTRWGTCNTKAKRVWINVHLIKFPPECLDYVVLHDLAHLKEASHNQDFKRILDEYMPTWRTVRKKLDL